MYHVFYFGYLATVLKAVSFIPLVYKIYKHNHTAELSLLMYICLTLMMFCWIYYSTNAFSFKDNKEKKVDYTLFIANVIAICFVSYILYKILYNKFNKK